MKSVSRFVERQTIRVLDTALLLLIIGALLTGCGPQPTPATATIDMTPEETSVTAEAPESAATATPAVRATAAPAPNSPTEALQQLVAAVLLRTDRRQVSNAAGIADLYVTYVDEEVRSQLVAYRAAQEGWSAEHREQMTRQLEDRLREQNEFPVLLYVQPAAGTRVGYLHLGLGSTDRHHERQELEPTRSDSIFGKEIDSDASGFFYFPYLDQEGVRVIDPDRDAAAEFHVSGSLSEGYQDPGWCGPYRCGEAYGDWPAFSDSFYVDLQPTDTPPAALPDAVTEHMVGGPSTPPPKALDANVQWNLSAGDVADIINILLNYLVMMEVRTGEFPLSPAYPAVPGAIQTVQRRATRHPPLPPPAARAPASDP